LNFTGSLARALTDIYPEYSWNPRKIPKVEEEYRGKLILVAKKLGLQGFEDWYKVKAEDVKLQGIFLKRSNLLQGAESVMNIYGGSLIKSLENNFPEFEWKPWRFASTHLPVGSVTCEIL
jgi:hypothetical protein